MLRQVVIRLFLVVVACAWSQLVFANEKYDLNIPAQNVAEAVKTLSYQTRHSILFHSDDLGDAKTQAISGAFSLVDALNALLKGTGLQGGLTESGVMVVSLKGSVDEHNDEKSTMKKRPFKLSLIAGAISAFFGGSPVSAQTQGDAAGITALEEIIVTGRRYSQESAIAGKRNNDRIIDLLAADQAGRLPDNNVAESLSRIPGVSVQRNGDTGNGEFISIRGLDSALNNIQFNGVNSGLSNNAGDRRVPLDGISAEDISEIRVAKSLLPQDEGEGIGGAINVISKSPLDRGEDQFRLDVSGRYGEFSDRTGHKAGFGFTKIISDAVGVSLSVTQRRRYIQNLEINSTSSNPIRLPEVRDVTGQLISVTEILDNDALNDPGDSYDNVEPGFFSTDDITFEKYGYELGNLQRDTLSISGAIDWQVSEYTRLTLGGFLSEQEAKGTEYTLAFDVDDDDFVNINGVLNTIFDDPEVDFEARLKDDEESNGNLYLRGVTELDRLTLKYQASFANASESTPRIELGFNTGPLIQPSDGSEPNLAPFVIRDRYFPVPNAGAISNPLIRQALTDFSGTQEVAFFEVAGIDRQENDRYALKFDADFKWNKEFLGGVVSNLSFGAKAERSELELRFVEFTLDENDVNLDGSYSDGDGTSNGASLGDFSGLFAGTDSRALRNVDSPLSNIGVDPSTGESFSVNGLPVLDDAAFRAFGENFLRTFNQSGAAPESVFAFDIREDVIAAYTQAEVNWDKLTVIAGVRIEDYQGDYTAPSEVSASLNLENARIDLTNDTQLALIRTENSNTEVLPRMALTYRLNGRVQFRAGIGQSIARPTFLQLGLPSSIDIDIEANDGVLLGANSAADVVAAGIALSDLDDVSLDITSGNPDLENAKSLNIDFSAEFYPNSSTLLSAGLFYKEIDNFIFVGQESESGGEALGLLNQVLSADGTRILDQLGGIAGLRNGDFDVSISQPRNGGTADIYGLEIGVVHAFDWGTGFLKNMGFTGNVTFTESDATYDVATLDGDDDALVELGFFSDGDVQTRQTTFFGAPDVSANASIYYEANGWEVALSASYQSEAFNFTDGYGLDQFNASYFQADFFIGYDLPINESYGKFSVFLEIPDITDDGQKGVDVQSVGRDSNLFDEASFNGREINIGIRGRF